MAVIDGAKLSTTLPNKLEMNLTSGLKLNTVELLYNQRLDGHLASL